MTVSSPSKITTRNDQNKIRIRDRVIHDWYRFVLSFPPHLVQDYLDRFNIGPSHIVLDPFCGTGTTPVECKKHGVESVGIESNPMAHFASSVKTNWGVNPSSLKHFTDVVVRCTNARFSEENIDDWNEHTLFAQNGKAQTQLKGLEPEQEKLLLKNSISPVPLHRTLILLDAIDRHGDSQLQHYGRLALAHALVHRIGNLKFGPEVGVGRIKQDAPVVIAWRDAMETMIRDLSVVSSKANVSTRIHLADSRGTDLLLAPNSIDAVITSPPYPNEKDYTRTTRLESVILGMIRNRKELQSMKKALIRSNTRGVYKADTDDRIVAEHAEIQRIANEIEKRRVALGKTSGFERTYPRVTQLYFGGMARHLASLRTALKPGARLAYVVGDQASYLRVMIRTGQILSDLAQSLGYKTIDIDLFRTRPSTVTGAIIEAIFHAKYKRGLRQVDFAREDIALFDRAKH